MVGNERNDGIEKIGNSGPVLGRDGVHRPDGQFVKLSGHLHPFPGVDLVRCEEEPLLPLAEHGNDLLVEREDTVSSVDENNDRVGLVDGPKDLTSDLREDIPFFPRQISPRIDQTESLAVVLRGEGDKVAGNPRLPVGDRPALPRDPVKERGLPHVRTPYERNTELGPRHIQAAAAWFPSGSSLVRP
jgi:hypothetical protein